MKTKKKLKPRTWPTASLEELRARREIAVIDGDLKLAFKIAFEIDKARGLGAR